MAIYRSLVLITVVLFVVGLLMGCESNPTRKTVEAAKTLHDKQLVAGETLICGTSLRALVERYGGDPGQLEHVLALCGYLEYFERINRVK